MTYSMRFLDVPHERSSVNDARLEIHPVRVTRKATSYDIAISLLLPLLVLTLTG